MSLTEEMLTEECQSMLGGDARVEFAREYDGRLLGAVMAGERYVTFRIPEADVDLLSVEQFSMRYLMPACTAIDPSSGERIRARAMEITRAKGA